MKKKITISLDETILSKIDSDVSKGEGKNRSQVIETILANQYGEFADVTAIIFAHDDKWDNRDYPFDVPKVFLEVKGKTVIENQIGLFSFPGIKNFIFTVDPSERSFFEKGLAPYKSSLDIHFVEVPREAETGIALQKVLDTQDCTENLLIANGDIYYGSLDLAEYYDYHKAQKSDFSLCLKFVLHPEQLGNVKVNGNTILEFVDRPNASQMNLTNSGLYFTTLSFLKKHDFGDYLEKDFFPKLPKIANNIGYVYSGVWEHIQNDSAYERVNGWLI